jgi:hypothetical protein
MCQQSQHNPATHRIILGIVWVPMLIPKGVCGIPAVRGAPLCFGGDGRMAVVPERLGYTEKVISPLPGYR